MKNRKTMSFVIMIVMMLQFVLAANVFAAPAPGISSYQIYAVGSGTTDATVQWELMTSPSQSSTVRDHSGAKLYVVTKQMGYDAYTVPNINGVKPTLARTDVIVSSGIVVGFYYYWNCSGQQQGQFTATAYSINTYKPFSAWIYIK